MSTGMPVENPARRKFAAGFGGRLAETERPKGRHRAAGRPYLADQALDEVRRGYWNELRRIGDQQAAKRFKEARWCPLKKPEKLTDNQALAFARLKAAGVELSRAYELKAAVRGIFQPGLTIDDVEILIDGLLSHLARRRLEPFVRLGKTIRRHPDGILAASASTKAAPALTTRSASSPAVRLPRSQGRTRARAAHLRARHPSPTKRAARSPSRVTLATSMPREPGFAVLWLGSGLTRASNGPRPFFANALVQAWNTHVVPNDWRTNGVRVVRSDEFDTNTPQTAGMTRAAAITAARAGAEKLWAGTVIIEPAAKTGAHHHGPVESVIYVVSGRARMRWGERLEYVAEAGPGDFIYVPPYGPHQEINAESSEPLSCIPARSGQEPVVVNLDLAEAEPNPQSVHWVDDIHSAP